MAAPTAVAAAGWLLLLLPMLHVLAIGLLRRPN
jgi:hypothetical protein